MKVKKIVKNNGEDNNNDEDNKTFI